MPIFRRDSDESTPAATPLPQPRSSNPPAGAATTHVATGTRIEGKVSGSTEVLVDGEIDGELRLGGGIVIGEGGTVRGEIEARAVRIGGKVHGNIRAGDRVEVLNTGTIEGDVAAPRVVIADGAFFKGKVEMTGQEEAPPARAAAAAPASRTVPPAQPKLEGESGKDAS